MFKKLTQSLPLVLTLSLLLSSLACAAEIKLQLQGVDQSKDPGTNQMVPTAYVGESFRLDAVVSGGDRNTGQVLISGLDPFRVSGRSKSTNISMINNQMSATTNYQYGLLPHNEGTFTIGPARVEAGGQQIESNTVTIRIIARPAGQQAPHRQQGPTINRVGDEIELFAKMSIATDEVFVGQPVIATVRIYTRGPILQVSMEPPKFSGFLSKEVPEVKKIPEMLNDKQYTVIEKRFILTPISEGEQKIEPFLVSYNVRGAGRRRSRDFFDQSFFDDFFGSRVEQKNTLSNELNLTVKKLPKSKEISHGVGEFTQLTATLDKKEAEPNEALLLKLTVKGSGNFEQVTAPKIKLPHGFKFYDSRNYTTPTKSADPLEGEKTFEYVIQIPKPGTFEVPPQTLRFYSPQRKSYRNIQSETVSVTILDTGSKPASILDDDFEEPDEHDASTPTKEKKMLKDIHYIQENAPASKTSPSPLPWWLFLLLITIPTIILNTTSLFSIKQHITEKFFSSRAQKLAVFEQKVDTLIKQDNAVNLYKLLHTFLSVKLEIPEEQLTHELIDQKLQTQGVPTEKIQEFMEFLNDSASLRFVADSKGIGEKRALLKRGKYWIIFLGTK